MNKNDRTRNLLRLAALGGMALLLVGCDSIREAAGVTKEPPDEFAVVTKAPLVMPPDYNLRPPKPGAAPTNQQSPTDSAREALSEMDPATIATQMTGDYSQEEKIVLANTGGAVADHAIRQQIAADAKSMEATNDELTTKLLFEKVDTNAGNPVDADAEKQRLDAAKSAKENNAPAGSTDQSADSKEKPDDSATIQKGGSGWLDGIF